MSWWTEGAYLRLCPEKRYNLSCKNKNTVDPADDNATKKMV